MEASLIAELIRRDRPYYDPSVTPEVVADLNQFAQDMALLDTPVPYEQIVATEFCRLW
jgi:hypothetical protein